MENTANKLPGIIWRIVSFIPFVNWMALLYIGAINSNTANIICSLLYGIITFMEPSVSALLWLVTVIHYALAYNKVKQREKSAEEHTQTISPHPIPVAGQIKVSLAMTTSQSKFFSDMKKYASFAGEPTEFVPFTAYWPTYDRMNKQQQAWYFYWRSQLRQGNYMDTDISYIFIFIYELISGVGWQNPQEGYEMLIRIWVKYKNEFPKLNYYLSDWTFDFAYLHNITYTAPTEIDMVKPIASTITDISIEQHAVNVPLKLPFTLIDALCDYSLVNSKFYKDDNQTLMQEAIPRVVALADAALRKTTQKGILATYGPDTTKEQEYYVFRNAICPYADQKITLTVKAYSTNQRLRDYMNELVRYGENTLRAIKNSRGRLRGITLDDATATLIESFLKKEYGQPIYGPNDVAQKTEIALNFKNIDVLREQSNAVRIALHVEETVFPEKKALLTDTPEVSAIYNALSTEARHFLGRLKDSGWECEHLQEDEIFVTEINRLAEHYLGCALLMKEQNLFTVEDDYRDELEHIYENPPQLSEEEKDSQFFDLSALSSELKTFLEQLIPEQQRALHALLVLENPQSELEQIAEISLTMPQIILDDINEIAIQILGDLIIESMDCKPYVLSEYIAPLQQAIA